MPLKRWLTWAFSQNTPSVPGHRLRHRRAATALQPLESRLYLGAVPGGDAIVWSAPPTDLPPEPAIVEFATHHTTALPQGASDPLQDPNVVPVSATTTVEDPTPDDLHPPTPTEGSTSPTTPPPVPMQTPVAMEPEVLLTALEEPPASDTPPESTPPGTLPLTSSAVAPTEPIGSGSALQVTDPNSGGASGGSAPFGAGMQEVSAGTGPSTSTPTPGFHGIPAVRYITNSEDPLVIRYDFRDLSGHENGLTAEQQAVVETALEDWETALHGAVQFERDTTAPTDQILNIGLGDLGAFQYQSAAGGTLGMGGGSLQTQADGTPVLQGLIWLDQAEAWDNQIGNGNVAGTYDLYTVVSHEVGHALGLEDSGHDSSGAMNGSYQGERSIVDLYNTVLTAGLLFDQPWANPDGYSNDPSPMMADYPQLAASEVQQILANASMVTPSEDAIIAVVDRNGRILGVRVEQEVLDTITDPATLVFAIDGAVAKARTAALFANGDPSNTDKYSPNGDATPLTSRLVRFISQSTVTQREVESNPNVMDPDSPLRGPGFVAPIGLGGHFPAEVSHTPPVDLFGIEHTNRDSIIHPGEDLIRGTADDFELLGRFNIDNSDPTVVPPGQELYAPESYGYTSGILPSAQSRGLATLPGGIPIFRDTDGNLVGDTLIGGVGVFFPGSDGYATFEQGFIPGIGQTEEQRTNAAKVLEAEFIAVVAAGGSIQAQKAGAQGAKPDINSPFDIPFGRLDLVGIQLQVIGPTAGIQGVIDLVNYGNVITDNMPGTFANSGADQPIDTGMDGMPGTGDENLYADGKAVPEGWLVLPQDSTDGTLTAAQVEQLVMQAIAGAEETRSAIRLTAASDPRPGARTRMVIAIADTNGAILGLYRMPDSTVFSIDVAVAKARNMAYYNDASQLQPEDQVTGIEAGTAFTTRTFRFLSEPRFPSGVDGSQPPQFSILNAPGIDPLTGENTGAALPASAYNGTALGYDAFNPMTNFHDPGDPGVVAQPTMNNTERANQNGVIFFPGSTALYVNGSQFAGGFGISGDGVDQDDVVTVLGADGFLPDGLNVTRADQVFVNGVRLPYNKFLRNPFG